MKIKGSQLLFLSRIHSDGLSLTVLNEADAKYLTEDPFAQKTKYTLSRLSISEGLYIASEFATYVVKLKPQIDTNEQEK